MKKEGLMKTYRKIGETKNLDKCKIFSAKISEREKNIKSDTRPSDIDFCFNYSDGVV